MDICPECDTSVRFIATDSGEPWFDPMLVCPECGARFEDEHGELGARFADAEPTKEITPDESA